MPSSLANDSFLLEEEQMGKGSKLNQGGDPAQFSGFREAIERVEVAGRRPERRVQTELMGKGEGRKERKQHCSWQSLDHALGAGEHVGMPKHKDQGVLQTFPVLTQRL